MLIKKSSPDFVIPPPTAASKEKNSASPQEALIRLLLVTLGVSLLIALVSYSPADPSWSTWSSRAQFRNWLGRLGSYSADLLFIAFGVTAIALGMLPLIAAYKSGKMKLPNWKVTVGAHALLLFSLSLLFQQFIDPAWTPWKLQNSGGLVGFLGMKGVAFICGSLGTTLLGIVGVCASLLWLLEWDAIAYVSTHVPPLLKRLQLATEQLYSQLKAKWEAHKAKEAATPTFTEPLLREPPPVPSLPAIPLQMLPASPSTKTESTAHSSLEEVITPSYVPPVSKPVEPTKPAAKRAKGSPAFEPPSVSLISGRAESKVKTVERTWFVEKANILVQKLKDFGVEGEVVNISPGPVITVYEFKPASGVKIKEIANLSDDLTLALSVLSVRIVAPIPGKPVVGIEIPSPHREMVFFKDLIQETPFFTGEIKIPIALGRLASGEPVTADLASMPHLLIAGSTGTGKSVFINTLISSLLYRFAPSQLKLILVDPKMVELSQFEGIPHLMLPVVVDSKKAVLALRWAVEEMERRYTLMHQSGVRHVDMYNERLAEFLKDYKGAEPAPAPLPYIVIVIDEYADLMAVVPKDVELSIARLAQKARASGIHLVLATQRPSTDVVTGTIKANFPSRISFRVASSIDSKTILDRTGADRLLGHGDLLFHSAGFGSLKRMQGPFLSDADLEKIVAHLKAQGEPEYDERILQAAERGSLDDSPGGGEPSDADNRLYDQALRLVSEKGEASISLIQRHLRIGYNRAALLMDQLEKEGVVGESAGPAKRRAVLVGNHS